MIKLEQIPDEVVEAAMQAFPMLGRDEVLWLLGNALKAWPNAEWGSDDGGGSYAVVLLPLAEPTDD